MTVYSPTFNSTGGCLAALPNPEFVAPDNTVRPTCSTISPYAACIWYRYEFFNDGGITVSG